MDWCSADVGLESLNVCPTRPQVLWNHPRCDRITYRCLLSAPTPDRIRSCLTYWRGCIPSLDVAAAAAAEPHTVHWPCQEVGRLAVHRWTVTYMVHRGGKLVTRWGRPGLSQWHPTHFLPLYQMSTIGQCTGLHMTLWYSTRQMWDLSSC